MEQKSEYVGKIACCLCGNECGVKKSPRGRMTVVCKWQDGGCGSQLQTLTSDSGMRLIKRMLPIESAAKPAEKQKKDKKEKHGKDEVPCKQPAHAPSVKESEGFGGFW